MQGLLCKLGIGITQPKFSLHRDCPPDVQETLWSSYLLQRRDGLAAVYSRKTQGLTVRIYQLQSHVVKEYTGDTSKLATELSVLQQLHHNSLTSYLFIVHEGARVSVVMDWAGQGLRSLVKQQQPLGEDAARYVAFQLADSLAHLHSKGIVHRDIKPDNIGVQPDLAVKLFDWGEALLLDQLQPLTEKQLSKVAGVAGTPLYMAPEVLLYVTKKGNSSSSSSDDDTASISASSTPAAACTCWGASSSSRSHSQQQQQQQQQGTLRQLASPKLDIWGLGAVVYLLLAGRDILDDSYDLADMADIVTASRGIQLPAKAVASAAARDFLARALEVNPAQRACAQELLAHRWLSGMAAAARAQRARLAATGSDVKQHPDLSLPRGRSSEQAAAYVIAAHRGLLPCDSSSAPDTPVSGTAALSDTSEFAE